MMYKVLHLKDFKMHDTHDLEVQMYIERLEQFIADNVDPSYFDDDDENDKFWTEINIKVCPENYDEEYVKEFKYEYK